MCRTRPPEWARMLDELKHVQHTVGQLLLRVATLEARCGETKKLPDVQQAKDGEWVLQDPQQLPPAKGGQAAVEK